MDDDDFLSDIATYESKLKDGSIAEEQMEAEAASWLAIEPQPVPGTDLSYAGPPTASDGSPRGKARRKRGAKAAATDIQPTPAAPSMSNQPPMSGAEPADPNGESNSMSNKTLDVMLSRLQGQLPPATYEKVINLVRDVQTRRMSLSRSEFLQHFQAICAQGAAQK